MQKNVFIAAPSCVASGGPELLHQLCFKLNKFGFNAKMLYYANTEENLNTTMPIHSNYEMYNNPYTTSLEDASSEAAIVIIPEVAIELIHYIKRSRMVIWWLSVDNYYDNIEIMYKKDIRNNEDIDIYGIKDKDLLHFVQSYYAKDFIIKRLGISEEKVYYLSDYLRKDFEEKKVINKRKDYCLFNPKKGFDKVLHIMSKKSNLGWLPIDNMTPKQVVDLMDVSKVYIDFGNHPGKDRIPREAAMRGCCIITNRAGSAAYGQDVSILEKYKFEDVFQDAESIIELIEDIYLNFDEHEKEFDSYRKKIAAEERTFDEDVLKIFEELVK